MIIENFKHLKNKKKISSRQIINITITIIAIFIQLISLGKAHYFIIPPSLTCDMVLTQTSLDDNSTLIIDSQGKRMLFTNPEGQLINAVKTNGPESKASKILEISSNNDEYIIHGVNEINQGIYLSSEVFLQYDKNGEYKNTISKTDFSEEEYVTSVDLLFETPPEYFYPDEEKIEIKIPFSTQFFIKNLLFYVAGGWLIIIAFTWIVRTIRKKITTKIIIGCFIAGFMILAIICHSVTEYNQIKTDFNNNIIQATKQITTTLQDKDNINKLTEISNSGINEYLSNYENKTTFNNFRSYINDICKTYGKDQGIYAAVALANISNSGNILLDTRDMRLTGKRIELSQNDITAISNSNVEETTQLSLTYVDTIYDYAPIKNPDGQNAAYLMVGSNTDNMLNLQITKILNLIVVILAIIIGIYVAISAMMMCKDSIKRCLHQKTYNLSERIANLSGMYMLIYKFAYSIDSFLVVYISASMTTNLDPTKQAVLAAAPIALFYIGQWFGTLFSAPLIKRLGERNLAIISSVFSIFIMLFLAWTVLRGDIFLYSIGRLFMGLVVSGVLYVISGTLPICAKDKKQRQIAIEASMRGSIAAAIITTLIGGYTSEFAGYEYLYYLGAAMCGLLLLMTIFTFGRRNKLNSQEQKPKYQKDSLKGAWLIFLRPEFLMYIIFFGIPDLLISGYSSYIFPLIASESEMSVVLYSNLGVFSLTLMYLCQKPVDRFSKNFSSKALLVFPSLAICIGLLCFMISPNIYWATIMMLLPGILSYMTNVSEKVYLIEVSEKYKQNPTLVQSNYYTIYSGIQTGSTPILSSFMLLGLYSGCVALGAVCGVMYCIFWVFCKKKI